MQLTDSNELKDNAAELLESTARSLREAAAEQSDQLAAIASKAAAAIGYTAGYLRQNDIQAMTADAEQAVKRYPGPSLAAAAAVGFLLGVALRRR